MPHYHNEKELDDWDNRNVNVDVTRRRKIENRRWFSVMKRILPGNPLNVSCTKLFVNLWRYLKRHFSLDLQVYYLPEKRVNFNELILGVMSWIFGCTLNLFDANDLKVRQILNHKIRFLCICNNLECLAAKNTQITAGYASLFQVFDHIPALTTCVL